MGLPGEDLKWLCLIEEAASHPAVDPRHLRARCKIPLDRARHKHLSAGAVRRRGRRLRRFPIAAREMGRTLPTGAAREREEMHPR
jgi:hypothetical protein